MKITKKFNVLAFSVALAAAGYVYAGDTAVSQIQVSDSGVSFVVAEDVASYQEMLVRVSGPNGDLVVEERSVEGYYDLAAAGLPDGTYRWDMYVLDKGTNAAKQTGNQGSLKLLERRSGEFKVTDGVVSDTTTPQREDDMSSLWDDLTSSTKYLASVALEYLIPAAEAADLTASSTNPFVAFDDTGTAGTEFQIFGDNTRLRTGDIADSYQLYVEQSNPITTSWHDFLVHIQSDADVFIGNDPTVDSGDFDVNQGQLFVDRQTGHVGVNTTTPTEDLQVASGYPTLFLDHGGAGDFLIRGGSNYFNVTDGTTGNEIFGIHVGAPWQSLMIKPNGDIGVGVYTTEAALHVNRTDGTAQVLVDEDSAVVAARELFKLRNSGNTKFSVTEKVSGHNWAFANPGIGAGEFRLSQQDSGVVEMTIFNGGNVTIAGSLTQGSDRSNKTEIRELDTSEILAKVQELSISKWQYKHEQGVDHIGPMSQDFKAAFGLGNTDKGIVAVDADGVALAAIQELAKRNQMLEQRIAELEADRDRLNALEKVMVQVLQNQSPKTQRVTYK